MNQGDEMLAMTIVVCAGIALLSAAVGLATRFELGPRIDMSRRAAAGGFGAATLAVGELGGNARGDREYHRGAPALHRPVLGR